MRHVVQDEIDDNYMLRPDFLRGIGALQHFQLTYDLLLFPRHLATATSMVHRFPQQPFVLDHLGKPEIRSKAISTWAGTLRDLAKSGNVWCNLSGMVTEAVWGAWQASDFTQYLDVALNAFGPGRVMVGSDWPMCLLSGGYGPVMVERVIASSKSPLKKSDRIRTLVARMMSGSIESKSDLCGTSRLHRTTSKVRRAKKRTLNQGRSSQPPPRGTKEQHMTSVPCGTRLKVLLLWY